MSPDELLAIARDWSFWDRPVPESVPRQIQLPHALQPDRVLVIQGVRRCGKSTLLGQLLGRYDLDPRRCLFLNFEDPRLAGHLGHPLLEAVASAFEAALPAGPIHLFLDEVQHVEGWQAWVRAQVDRPGARHVVVTGSSAHLLSGDVGSTLTGRHLTVELFPFSLSEARAAVPDLDLAGWLHEGGFPAALGSPDGEALRRTYVGDIVERDVRARVGARSSAPLRHLTRMLFESAGAEWSTRRAASAIGVAPETAALYLDALEAAYLAFACPYFAWSERKRQARNRKYYPVDTGLRRAVATPGAPDRGKALECATWLHLRRTFGEVYYWRGTGEVDFVVLEGGTPRPIQVTWEAPGSRHAAALDEFLETHPRAAEPVVVTAATYEEATAQLVP